MDADRRARCARAQPTLSDLMRMRFKGVLDPVAGFFNWPGADAQHDHPGRPGWATSSAGVLLASGNFLVGGILVLIMGAGRRARWDDGAPARRALAIRGLRRFGHRPLLGALHLRRACSSTTSSIGDDLMVLAWPSGGRRIGAGLLRQGARRRSLGFEATGGILTRFERYLVLGPALLVGAWPRP